MIGARIKAVALTGMVCTVVAWWTPVRGQEVQAVQSEVLVALNPTGDSTTADPEISLNELRLLVKPLTKPELESEAEVWQGLLKAKVKEISDAEIAIKRQNQEAKEALDRVTELQFEAEEIVERFNLVLEELEKKGGETEQYQTYINAVSGLEIDVTDTEGLRVRLVEWLTSEKGGWRWGINIAKFVAIMAASIYISKILNRLASKALSQIGASGLLRQFITTTIERGGLVLGLMLALTALEVISLGQVFALLGGISFVLAFALQSNLGNFASGLMIMLTKPFDVGDEVKVSDLWGWVDSISLANTKIKGFTGEVITVPNNTIWDSIIENLTASEIRGGSMYFRLPFKENIRKVEQILLDIAKSHPLILEEPGPGTFPWQYEEYYISIGLSFKTKTPDFWEVWSDLLRMIQERFEQEGIEIALPID